MILSHRIRFYDQLYALVRSGVTLPAAVDRVAVRLRADAITLLQRAFAEKADAREAFAAAGFKPFEVNLVAAGERSGRLDDVFAMLARYFKQEREVARSLWGALAYPIVLLHLIALIGPLPELVTGTLFGYLLRVGATLFWLYLAGGLICGFVMLTWHSAVGQRFWMLVPLVRGFLRATFAYRWILALRMELAAGLPFYQAGADAWLATGYADATLVAARAREAMLGGATLSELMPRWSRLPEDWADYMATAEHTGRIDDTLGLVEERAEADWLHAKEKLVKWLPWIMYFALVLVAGFMVFWSMYERMQKISAAFDGLPL